jgi:exoribonuclease R
MYPQKMIKGHLYTKDYVRFQIKSTSDETLLEFEGAGKANKALPGDHVLWNSETSTCTCLKRANHTSIVGSLELNSKTKYGMTSRGAPLYLLVPFKTCYPFFIVGSTERNVSENQIAVVDFDDWSTTGFPRGNLRQLLGSCKDIAIQSKALLLTYNPFKEPKGLSQQIPPALNLEGRQLCPPKTFNIDPPGCKDIDDVLSLQRTDAGIELWITIADVAETVLPGSNWDVYAQTQGMTAYQNGAAVKPMLPTSLSEQACSLLPGVERAGVSLVMTLDSEAPHTIKKSEWKLTRLVNWKQYEYDSFIEESKHDGIETNILAHFAKHILGFPTQDPHEWIEACMLYYNIQTAKVVRTLGHGILRKHEMPDYELLNQYTSLGGADLAVLANRSAQYCLATDSTPMHHGLSAQVYCHATSPIRRYADLVNQRVLKAFLLGQEQSASQYSILALNERQQDLKRYERDLFFLQQITTRKKGEVNAIVLHRSETKTKLWIPSWKRTFNWKTEQSFLPGTELELSYYANPSARRWKERIVFRFEGLA